MKAIHKIMLHLHIGILVLCVSIPLCWGAVIPEGEGNIHWSLNTEDRAQLADEISKWVSRLTQDWIVNTVDNIGREVGNGNLSFSRKLYPIDNHTAVEKYCVSSEQQTSCIEVGTMKKNKAENPIQVRVRRDVSWQDERNEEEVPLTDEYSQPKSFNNRVRPNSFGFNPDQPWHTGREPMDQIRDILPHPRNQGNKFEQLRNNMNREGFHPHGHQNGREDSKGQFDFERAPHQTAFDRTSSWGGDGSEQNRQHQPISDEYLKGDSTIRNMPGAFRDSLGSDGDQIKPPVRTPLSYEGQNFGKINFESSQGQPQHRQFGSEYPANLPHGNERLSQGQFGRENPSGHHGAPSDYNIGKERDQFGMPKHHPGQEGHGPQHSGHFVGGMNLDRYSSMNQNTPDKGHVGFHKNPHFSNHGDQVRPGNQLNKDNHYFMESQNSELTNKKDLETDFQRLSSEGMPPISDPKVHIEKVENGNYYYDEYESENSKLRSPNRESIGRGEHVKSPHTNKVFKSLSNDESTNPDDGEYEYPVDGESGFIVPKKEPSARDIFHHLMSKRSLDYDDELRKRGKSDDFGNDDGFGNSKLLDHGDGDKNNINKDPNSVFEFEKGGTDKDFSEASNKRESDSKYDTSTDSYDENFESGKEDVNKPVRTPPQKDGDQRNYQSRSYSRKENERGRNPSDSSFRRGNGQNPTYIDHRKGNEHNPSDSHFRRNNEHNPSDSNSRRDNEHNPSDSNSRRDNEHNLSDSYSRRDNEHNSSDSYSRRDYEHNSSYSNSRRNNEHNLSDSYPRRNSENNPSDSYFRRENEHNPSDSYSRRENEHNPSDPNSRRNNEPNISDSYPRKNNKNIPSGSYSRRENGHSLSDSYTRRENEQNPSDSYSRREIEQNPSDSYTRRENEQNPSDSYSRRENGHSPSESYSRRENEQNPSDSYSRRENGQHPLDSHNNIENKREHNPSDLHSERENEIKPSYSRKDDERGPYQPDSRKENNRENYPSDSNAGKENSLDHNKSYSGEDSKEYQTEANTNGVKKPSKPMDVNIRQGDDFGKHQGSQSSRREKSNEDDSRGSSHLDLGNNKNDFSKYNEKSNSPQEFVAKIHDFGRNGGSKDYSKEEKNPSKDNSNTYEGFGNGKDKDQAEKEFPESVGNFEDLKPKGNEQDSRNKKNKDKEIPESVVGHWKDLKSEEDEQGSKDNPVFTGLDTQPSMKVEENWKGDQQATSMGMFEEFSEEVEDDLMADFDKEYKVRRKRFSGNASYVEEERKDFHLCRLPKPSKTYEAFCKMLPKEAKCNLYCIRGYTFPEGIVKQTSCSQYTGKWTTRFDECKPFVDCSLRLKSAGALNCEINSLFNSKKCAISCNREGVFDEAPVSTYECQPDGKWSPALPHCVVSNGVPLVPPPAVTEIKDFIYP